MRQADAKGGGQGVEVMMEKNSGENMKDESIKCHEDNRECMSGEGDDIHKNTDWKLLIIRLMAGGYLIYLAIHLLKEKGAETGLSGLLVPVLFLAAGAVIGGWAVVKLVRGEYER